MIRILPFGGKVVAIEIDGALLQRVLDRGQANKGTGGYLQTAKVSQQANSKNWLVQGQPLDPKRTYKIAINDFLISGKEKGLDFLNLQQPGIKLIAEKRDIRFVMIDRLKHQATSSNLLKSDSLNYP